MKLKDPIGQPLSQWGKKGTIVGVVEDFHFQSMRSIIKPLVIRSEGYASFKYIIMRVNPTNLVETIHSIEKIHADLDPNFPFTYHFSDQEYDNLYKSEIVFFKLSKYFAFIAILISCLGIFGLVMLTAQQKLKEIGIRKVLGATVFGIVVFLSKDFIKLVFGGIIIGCPTALYFMKGWLSKYEYVIDMPYW